MVHGAPAGLELLDALDRDQRIAGHYRLDAVRAHLFEMAGRYDEAIARYRAAAERTTSIPERDYLTAQAARLSEKNDSVGRPEGGPVRGNPGGNQEGSAPAR
jgi:predicted RNA polymerase sigma factor